jgi:ubiquinone/menaquinone biosynthesis C-methylase UbiE
VGEARVRGRVLNVGCGTGGFDVAAAAAGAWTVGVDEGAEAVAICGLRRGGGRWVRAASEHLPFADASFDLVHCFSTIEHVASVEATVGEMARVTRPGGAVYVHTPNAWSWYEGHYKLFWLPFMPPALGRLYLHARGRPTAYLATLRRLTPRRLARAFAAAGMTGVRFFDDDRPRESLGPLGRAVGLYYRATGIAPFVELVATRP